MRISDWSSDVCSSDLGRGAVTATYDLVYGPAEQEPFLLGQGNRLRLVLAAKSGDTGRGDKQLDLIRLGIARLEISFTVDGEGWIDSFQHVPDLATPHIGLFCHPGPIKIFEIGRAPVCTPVTNAHLV